jgi:pimeloyl-ACP methyl ester carboxylesterase
VRRALLLLIAAVAAAGLTTGLTAGHAAAASTIETEYNVAGPYATTTGTATDSLGNSYDLYYPANYAALGFKSPILTFGNGTGAVPSDYSVLLTRLASWGFTIIASTLENTGSGIQIDDGARYLVAQDTTAGSVFYGDLNTSEVGVFGHSQGATGAVNAATMDPTLYRTVLTFSLPAQIWSAPNPDCPTAAACTPHPNELQCPTFLISTHGLADSIIASPATETAYFNSIDEHAALGIIAEGTDHSSIENSGNPDVFLGYVTAWFMDQLRGDTRAAGAFSGADPELVTNANWPGSLVK